VQRRTNPRGVVHRARISGRPLAAIARRRIAMIERDPRALCAAAAALARRAGEAIMAVYRRDFDVEYKDDRSPLTEADLAAHHILSGGLAALSPSLPVLSEESADTV